MPYVAREDRARDSHHMSDGLAMPVEAERREHEPIEHDADCPDLNEGYGVDDREASVLNMNSARHTLENEGAVHKEGRGHAEDISYPDCDLVDEDVAEEKTRNDIHSGGEAANADDSREARALRHARQLLRPRVRPRAPFVHLA